MKYVYLKTVYSESTDIDNDQQAIFITARVANKNWNFNSAEDSAQEY